MSQDKFLTYGLFMELAALALAISGQTGPIVWISLFMAHATASVLLALFVYPLLPKNIRHPRLGMIGIAFAFCFALPLLGPLSMALVGVYLRAHPLRVQTEPSLKRLTLPSFDTNIRRLTEQRVIGLAQRALHTSMPLEKKLQVLMSLKERPSAASTRLLREALKDTEDEIRLVAYAILDRHEQRLMNEIIRLQAELEGTETAYERCRTLRQLTELHWEIIYYRLASGELEHFLLERAISYADEALSLYPSSIHLRLLRAKLLIRQGQWVPAETDLLAALQMGAPQSQTLPYLAELAFHSRNHAQVRVWLSMLDKASLSLRMQRLREMWVHEHD